MEQMDEGERLHAEVEALKIAVTFIALALPPAKRKRAQEHATAFCERWTEMIEATTTPDAQIAHVRKTLAALLTPEGLQRP